MNEATSTEQETTRKVEEELERPIEEYDGSQPLFKDPFWKRCITIFR